MTIPLLPGEVHLRFVFPDSPDFQDRDLLASYGALINAEERARQERYLFQRHRHQALLARALVRTTLSRYHDVPPARWSFTTNAHGKPEIAAPEGVPPLRFNLSHTSGLMVCATMLSQDVGVDVEDTRRRLSHQTLAERFFSTEEVRDLHAQDPAGRRRRFFALWTLKEAYLKARGTGLALPLHRLSFWLTGSTIRVAFHRELEDDSQRWHFALIHPTRFHTAALAIQKAARDVLTVHMAEVVPLSWERPIACQVMATC